MEQQFIHLAESGKEGSFRFRVSLDQPTWAWLLEETQIHPKFVDCLYYLLGDFATYVTYTREGKAETFRKILKCVRQLTNVDLAVKLPSSGHLEAAFYVRYNFQTKKTLVLVAGNDLPTHQHNLIEYLSEAQSSSNPWGLIYTLISGYFCFLENQKRRFQHQVIMMESVSGRGAIAKLGKNYDEASSKFDLPYMHWVGGNQRNIAYAFDFQVKLLEFLQEAHYEFVALQLHCVVAFNALPVEARSMQKALRSHKTTVQGVLDDSRLTEERAKLQLSAVSIISPVEFISLIRLRLIR
jgi:hypothetical protein